jgi:hypothetical protein|tara:strand:- start:464 stop:664 length:201 start_codon:yes stop_codon:yes gene_type:complete
MTQLQMIKQHFDTGHSLSGYEAANLYRIASLPRRINDLEAQGMKIKRETKKDTTGRRYVRYTQLAA